MHDTDQQLDENAQGVDQPPHPSVGDGGDDVMALLAGVEQQFERLRSVQATHADEVRTLAERSAELDHRQAELEQRSADLADQQGDLDRVSETLAQQHADVQDQRAQLDREREQLDEQLRQWTDDRDQTSRVLAERETELGRWAEEIGDHETLLAEANEQMAGLRQRLEESVAETSDLRGELEDARARLEQTREESASNEQAAMELLQETEQQRDELSTRLEEARLERDDVVARLEKALSERDDRVGALEHELEDANEKLQTAGRKLVEFSQRLSGQVPELERGAAIALELDEQRRRIEQLTRQLNDAEGDEVVRRKDEHIQELSRELETLRSRLAAEHDAEHGADERVALLERQAREEQERLSQDLHAAREQCARLEQELSELATRDHHEATGSDAEASADDLADLDGRLDEAEDTAEQLRRQLAAEREGSHRNTLEFQRQHAELTVALKQARADLEQARVGAARQVESPALQQFAAHLERRRERLRRARALQRSSRARPAAAAPASDGGSEQEQAKLRSEQLHLEEVRKLLVASEKQMVRKWARNRSVLAVCAIFILLTLNAGLAWKAAGMLFPPTLAATITLVPDGVPSMPTVERTAWAQWHTALLHDESVQVAIAERMGDRLLTSFESAAAVRTLIVKELGVDAGRGEGLALTLRRDNAEEARTALEVVVGTLIDESRRRAIDRGDTPALAAPALAAVGRDAISLLPIDDQRLAYAAPIFGGLCVVMLALFGIIYSQCSSSRRVLDEYAELFASSASTDPQEYEQSLKPLVWE